jgi:hypothetical protein
MSVAVLAVQIAEMHRSRDADSRCACKPDMSQHMEMQAARHLCPAMRTTHRCQHLASMHSEIRGRG